MKRQFENLRASELYCPNCKTAMPVRERLLLVIPGGELNAYRCEACGETLGTREVKQSSDIVAARGRIRPPD